MISSECTENKRRCFPYTY